MVKIATPISDLFVNKKFLGQIMRYSDCLECRDKSLRSTLSKQEVFHCELQPIHSLGEDDFRYLKHLSRGKKDLKLLTFHMASSCDKPYIVNGIFRKGGREYNEKEALNNAKTNFSKIRKIFANKVKLAIENNNYYPTDAYKYVTDPAFISRIVKENGLGFVFDIAHARITAHNQGIDYQIYKSLLPIDKAVQLHISSFRVLKNKLAFDTHDYPKEDEFSEVESLLKTTEVKYLTVEYYKGAARLIGALKLLKELI